MPRTSLSLVLSLAATLGGAAACFSTSGGSSSSTSPPPDPLSGQTSPVPSEVSSPSTYVAKVKNILVGLPPTDDEIKTVQADPTKLAGLIDGWMALPQYSQKMKTFFELAFQQTQVAGVDFDDMSFPRKLITNNALEVQFVQNARESFARTVLQIVADGRPFTETMTTQQFMMTPALMQIYAYLDAWQVDDMDKVTDVWRTQNPGLNVTITATGAAIPIADSLDPTNANYMHFYNADVANAGLNQPAGCQQDPIVYAAATDLLHMILMGGVPGHKNPTGGANCNQRGGTATSSQMLPADYTTWKMVTIRPPKGGEKPTPFYDLPTFRNGSELVLTIPRVGFFTTPAFFANWQTNMSNQARVTMNQTLIVALGAAVDGTDPTTPASAPGIDKAHASDPACFACHQTLDPTRSILSSTYSWTYHRQTEAKYSGEKGMFQFQGVTKQLSSVADLGATLAEHPLFPAAWAQKLCYYANSTACSTDDVEFQRVVDVFKSSKFSWNTLVRELMASPLTTHATATKSTDDHGEVVAVSRRDHLCAALNNRLGFTDVCALDAVNPKLQQTTIPQIVSGLPSDGYGRGALAPILPNEPSLFFRAGTENICEAVAAMVIDATKPIAGSKQWSSTQPDVAIADFVHILMALPDSDPRAAAAKDALNTHFTAAKGTGAAASDSLRSTFVVACLAPSAVAIGL